MTRNSFTLKGYYHTVMEIGFRPFFLLGLLFAPFSLLIWLGSLFSGLSLPGVNSLWHAHEMVFGFTMAIVAGFLFTATQNWAGKRGVHGLPLLLLVLFWLAGRIAFVWPGFGDTLRAVVDLGFLPLVILLLVPYLSSASQRRNVIFLLLILCLWISNVVFHFGHEADWLVKPRGALYFAIHLIILMIVVIGGRVIPFFSGNALTNYRGKKYPVLDFAAFGFAAAFALAFLWQENSWLTISVAFAAALVNAARLACWYDHQIWKKPILWILYVGYAWLPVGFALAGLAALGITGPSGALHAFSAGAISVMIVGMVSRVSLGHTGRPIIASTLTRAAYVLVILSAVLRVFGVTHFPRFYRDLLIASGSAWILAFVCLLVVYVPILLAPRPKREG